MRQLHPRELHLRISSRHDRPLIRRGSLSRASRGCAGDRELELVSEHRLERHSARCIPANMMGRLLDDADLRKPLRMLIKEKPPAPSVSHARQKFRPPSGVTAVTSSISFPVRSCLEARPRDEPIRPMTLGSMRRGGVHCGHKRAVSMDEWPDDATVRSFGRHMRCTRCGKLGRRLCPIGSNGSTDLIAEQRPAIMLPRCTPRAPTLSAAPQMYSMYRDDSDLWCSALPSRKTRTPLPGFCDDRSPLTLDVSRKLAGRSKGVSAGAVQRFLKRLIARGLMMPRCARNGATLNLSSPE
jgi:hypothetical protein